MADVKPVYLSRFVDYAAALAWAALAGVRLRQMVDGNPLGFLLALQAGLVAWLIVRRRPAQEESRLAWRVLAWGSASLPFAFQAGGMPVLPLWMAGTLSALGLGLVIWALLSLDEAFGVAPADRGLVVRGPYRWIRHPAYAGELISMGGFVLGSASGWNGGVFILLVVSLLLRSYEEEQRIAGYGCYAGRVRWRLVPGAW
jgi:protein-S-isoprenylcysteine O-methyltransferase Ste14